MSACWEVYLRKPPVCLLSKLYEASASNAVNAQIKGKEPNNYMAVGDKRGCCFIQLISPFCTARFPGCDQTPWFPGEAGMSLFSRLVTIFPQCHQCVHSHEGRMIWQDFTAGSV